jgi:hypothetical protein
MKTQKLSAIDDLTSPLFRIMSVHNGLDTLRRQFDNNICAFHIGNGFVLSVAHNLRLEATLFKSISEERYQADILPKLDPNEIQLFNQCFAFDNITYKRYINVTDQNVVPKIVTALKRINYDTRWISMYHNQICKPYLLIQQRMDQFYNNSAAHRRINPAMVFLDSVCQRQSYLIEIELIEAYYEQDISLYRIVNTHQSIIDLIPRFDIDSELYDVSSRDFYCLQSAPADLNPGRMISEVNIEGLMDQYSNFADRIGGNYNIQGLRYLIKGYFRFGSSGAPYLKFDHQTNTFKVNAIQSEACPIQLTIKNDINGNFQYINAIAAPIGNVIDGINEHINN